MPDPAARPHRVPAVLVTGATGFLGGLIAAVLLGRERLPVVALVRDGHDPEALVGRLLAEIAADGHTMDPAELRERLTLVPLPDSGPIDGATLQTLKRLEIRDLVHCAGCLDYFDEAKLEEVNVRLTERMLDLGGRLGVERFVFVSTAFSSGYIDGAVREELHGPPPADPTVYTRTKREAEWRVAGSGLPYLILRPSVVIGDSRTGRYSGKRYGLYQLWEGLERLLYDRYHPELHAVAPRRPFNFIHQDAFRDAFHRLFVERRDDAIVNLASGGDTVPTIRDVWRLWLDAMGHPERLHFYDRMAEIELARIHPRQRAFLMFASVNIDIAAHPWRFDTGTLDRLKADGLAFTDAGLATIAVCQRAFIAASPRLQRYRCEIVRRHCPDADCRMAVA